MAAPAIAAEHNRLPDSMVPRRELLPEVLPTDRLNARGRPNPQLRAELRHIPDARNALTVASVHAEYLAILAVARKLNHPVVWALAFPLAGRSFSKLAILAHEAAHRLLFSDQATNDFVGKWLLAYPGMVPFDAYRRSHFAHHKDEMGPEEPDVSLYDPYPVSPDSLRRKLVRDAVGISGYKNLMPLLKALKSDSARPVASRILGTQAAIATGFAVAGHPFLWLFYWVGPYMTVWRVINRLRAIAEHGGMGRSKDRRETTHHVRQGWAARFWVAPFNTGWHLAHHADMGIPFRNLPKLHEELVASGWVTEDIVYPNYRTLWTTLASGAKRKDKAPKATSSSYALPTNQPN